ncbi:uncharacterized protein LOC107811985 [Nicotiana tabacum]|uniref:Uncharacterized protein LOC107811985 n=2 Tax=Nicotiana TaxID=4085 RepID=A0A1S4BUC8_TOBAC|nr:PREDICTED: uncharacterized protein LOC104213491 [Nicotiana sylvestris]XP_016492477.1 PREDICTED: uncharacterized protein LOC107811985 [Nicotiana tabacum]
MNKFAYSQNALVGFVGVGEMTNGVYRSNGVVCPKPRRGGLFNSPLLQFNNQEMEGCDLIAGTELLDIILTKGRYDDENSDLQLASSPPFFCGSPPSRASNPLIQDAHFGNDNFVPIPQIPESAAAAPPPPFSSSGRMIGGGCVRVKFGNDSAPVRIEGFNCRGSCSISAVA